MKACEVLEYLSQKFPEDHKLVAVDVGAFLGSYALGLVKIFPNAEVYAIEACPSNFRGLERNCKNHPNIITCHLAVGDCNDGRVKMYVSSYLKGRHLINKTSHSNSLYKEFIATKEWAKKVDKVKVPGTTLDSFYEKYDIDVDYLKVNCEGCEYKMFASSEFLHRTRLVYLQMHLKTFDSKGFSHKRKKIEKILGKLFRCVDQSKTTGAIRQLWERED